MGKNVFGIVQAFPHRRSGRAGGEKKNTYEHLLKSRPFISLCHSALRRNLTERTRRVLPQTGAKIARPTLSTLWMSLSFPNCKRFKMILALR